MTVLDPTQSGAADGPDRWAKVAARREVVEEFAKYRAAAADTGSVDACGLPTPGYFDELVDADGRVRTMWTELSADFMEQGRAGLHRLDTRVRRLISDDAITYTEVSGSAQEQAKEPAPWRLDPIPLLVSAEDWTELEAGLVQRSRLLDAVLTDVYGARRTLTEGLLPPQVVFGHRGYVRAAHGISLPGRHQLFMHACDVSRWGDGRFRVLNDWAQAPSGAGYALADRRVVSATIPEAFELASPRPLTPFVRAMRLMLTEAAPQAGDEEPVVVVLSPGVHSETAFDQAYLASVLGFPLVESADLVVRDGRLWMRSLGTLEQVDVVLRRVDAEFSDPLDLRSDSRLGVVGLVEVLRRGAVTVVNTLGSGLLESPALAAFLPSLSRSLLDEDLKLPGVPSYWGGDEVERSHLTANLERLILRSTVDDTIVFGPVLSRAQREEWCARIDSEGWRWVGQEPAQFSIAPAVAGSGGLAAAPVALRLFSLAGRVGYRVMAGGLGQLHRRVGSEGLIADAAAKDVWVHAAPTPVPAIAAEIPDERERPTPTAAALEVVHSPRVLNDLFWLGRYNERAESTVRLLGAIHDRYQDYRYRPWMEGAGGMLILVTALSRMTGTAYPPTKPAAGQPISTAAGVVPPGMGERVPGGPHEFVEELGSRSVIPRPGEVPGASSATPEDAAGQEESARPPAPGQSREGGGEPQGGGGQSPEGGGQSRGGGGQSPVDGGQSQGGGGGESQFSGSSRQVQGGWGQSQSTGQGGRAQPQPAGPGGPAQTQSVGPGASTQSGSVGPGGPQSRSVGPGGSTQSQSSVSGELTRARSSGAGTGRGRARSAGGPSDRGRDAFDQPTEPIVLAGASWRDHQYLVLLTVDRELPGSLAYAVERYARAARAVRDQLSADTWVTLGAIDRAFAEYRAARGDRVAALGEVHARALSGLLALSGIDAEIMARDTGWHVMDIGRRLERALSLTSLLAAAFTDTYPPEVSRVVTEAVLQATASSVNYRRRHRGSVRMAAVAEALLFDAGNPRSLAYQLERLEADLVALPAASAASLPQRLLTEAQRMVRRLDPADLETTDDDGRRTELAELLDGVHSRLRRLAESFEATRLSVPRDIQPLWGSAQEVG